MKLIQLEIMRDEDTDSPRDDDNLGTMVCWHRRYNLGDKHEFSDPESFREWWEEKGTDGVLLPLYLMDHSGISISTGSFGDPWDSGQIGYIYATADKRGETPDLEAYLQSEVTTYNYYLTGDCYWFSCSDAQVPDDFDVWTAFDEDDTEALDALIWENEESCGGFLGSAWDFEQFLIDSGMREHISLPGDARMVHSEEDSCTGKITRYYVTAG